MQLIWATLLGYGVFHHLPEITGSGRHVGHRRQWPRRRPGRARRRPAESGFPEQNPADKSVLHGFADGRRYVRRPETGWPMIESPHNASILGQHGTHRSATCRDSEDVATALAEDVGTGDPTALPSAPGQIARGSVIARENARCAARAGSTACFRALDRRGLRVWQAQDGDTIAAGRTSGRNLGRHTAPC